MADNLTHKTDADYWAAENLKTILSSRSICLSCRFAFRRLGIERWNQKCSWDGHPAKKVSIKWRCKVLNALCLPSRLPLRILDVYPKCALDHDTPVDMSLGLLISCIQVSKAYASPLPSSTTCASSQMMSRTSTTVNAIMPLEAPGIHAMVGREIPGKLTMSSIRTVTAGLRMMNSASLATAGPHSLPGPVAGWQANYLVTSTRPVNNFKLSSVFNSFFYVRWMMNAYDNTFHSFSHQPREDDCMPVVD